MAEQSLHVLLDLIDKEDITLRSWMKKSERLQSPFKLWPLRQATAAKSSTAHATDGEQAGATRAASVPSVFFRTDSANNVFLHFAIHISSKQ